MILESELELLHFSTDQTNRPQIHTDDEPPTYEDPPGYEEVIKVGMEKEMRRSKRRRDRADQRERRRSSQLVDVHSGQVSQLCSLAEPFPIGKGFDRNV